MNIEGFLQDSDITFMVNVQIVSKWTGEHRAGIHIGYMELTDGTRLEVYRHPGGTFYGYEE